MPKSKKERKSGGTSKAHGYIAGAGEIVEQDVGETLRKNYMPYAMSVILSRAIPEIDGFKPSHRKLLYTMYKMGLLTGSRTKSANIVGQTMRLNPHGDAAIYETMVRLSRGYEALLHPLVDSKGNKAAAPSNPTSGGGSARAQKATSNYKATIAAKKAAMDATASKSDKAQKKVSNWARQKNDG